jgi:hypothetical protein
VQFLHLDPDPATQINGDQCGSGSKTFPFAKYFLLIRGINYMEKMDSFRKGESIIPPANCYLKIENTKYLYSV